MKMKKQMLLMVSLILFLALQALAQVSLKNKPRVIPGELVIKFKSDVVVANMLGSLSDAGIINVTTTTRLSCIKGTVAPGRDFDQVVAQCRAQANVEYVEPNYRLYAIATPPPVFPNDPDFSQLYGMHQSNDNDIDAPEAWELTTGSANIIVGVIDTGIDYDHEDLKTNIWLNPGESGGGKENNNIDDDGNGYKDDYRGWNFIYKSNDPYDDNDHGTHCAGTVGGVGNNGKGVAGVNWNVKLMALKFLGSDGSGGTAEAAEAIIYAVDNGAKVLSNSWGGGDASQVLRDAIQYAHDRGVLFIAAAGNDSKNTDASANYPSNYEVPNVVSVASNDNGDNISSFSNYGRRTVDLDRAVQDLVDDNIHTEGVIDIFKVAGIDKPDISILDDAFLQTFKDHPLENLRVRLLERLMADEIYRRQRGNLARSKSFRQQLEKTLLDYHNRLIDAKEVIEQMIAIRRAWEADDQRAQELGLTPEEIAFYDAVAANFMTIYDQPTLRDIVHEVVQTLKRNLKVDSTEPSREEIRAGVRSAVRMVLRRKKVREEDLEPFLGSVMVQAQALYAEWPLGMDVG